MLRNSIVKLYFIPQIINQNMPNTCKTALNKVTCLVAFKVRNQYLFKLPNNNDA